jgi:carboxyl-terminal processing protease
MHLSGRVLLSALLCALAVPAIAQTAPAADSPEAIEAAPIRRIPLDEIRRYVAVFNAVRAAYVEPVDDAKLMQSAIRGLLLELDPHSTYFSAEDAKSFDEQARGAYEGIGVEVQTLEDKVLKVIAPIDDSPAAKAGVLAGDLIVAVDGTPMSAMKDSEPLRGPAGSSVVLTLRREGRSKPLEVTVARQTIRLTSVRSRLLEPGYGYVRISTFQADTGADFARHAADLKRQSPGGLKGLVLDVRSNPGGLLTAAVQVADDLLDAGVIVSTRGRLSISDSHFEATPGDLLEGVPVMVLVDAGSASASEVLAGALRDNKRARVIGSRTFGKGSVQTVLPLDNGDSVKLTTARYYTPSGRSIQAVGIEPDVVLHAEGDTAGLGYRESVLPGHLQGDEEAEAAGGGGDFLPGEEPIKAALAELKAPGSYQPPKPAAAQAPDPAAEAADPQTVAEPEGDSVMPEIKP